MKRVQWVAWLVALAAIANGQNPVGVEDLVVDRAAPNCVGLAACGMGKIGIVGTASGDAIFVNPAILPSLDKTSITAGGRVLLGSIDDPRMTAKEGTYSASLPAHVKLTHASVALPVIIANSPFTFGAGVGYHTAYDYGENLTTRQDATATDSTVDRKGGLNVLSPSVAVGWAGKYFVGLALNFSILGTLSADQNVQTPLSSNELYYEATGSALYPSFGVMARPIANLTLAASFTPGFDWKFTKSKTTTTTNGVIVSDIPQSIDESISMPWMLGAAAQYQVLSRLAVAADFQTRMFSVLTRAQGPLKDGIAAHAGAQYDLGKVPLRAGVFMEALPVAAVDYTNPTSPGNTPSTELGVTAGASIPIKSVSIDLAVGWSSFTKQDKDSVFIGQPARTYDYSENRFRFDLGVTVNLPGVTVKKGEEVKKQGEALPEPVPEPDQRRPHY